MNDATMSGLEACRRALQSACEELGSYKGRANKRLFQKGNKSGSLKAAPGWPPQAHALPDVRNAEVHTI